MNYLAHRRKHHRSDLTLSILFVVADTVTLGDDQYFKDEMEARGHTVYHLDDGTATGSEGSGNDVICISGTIDTGVLTTEFNNTTYPLVIQKRELWDNNDLCTLHATDGGETLWDVTDSSHAITSHWGYSGNNLACFTSLGTYSYSNNFAAAATNIMNTEGVGTTQSNLFVYDSGDTMENSHTAENNRAAFGPTSGDASKFETETWNILESTLLWAAGKI